MRKLQKFFIAMSALFLAQPAFAQAAGGGEASTGHGLIAIAAGVGMGLAAAGCGLGQGRAVASASEAVARNPGAGSAIQNQLVLGLAFIESLTLFTLLIIVLKVK